MGFEATKIGFDMNLMNLEPLGLESIELMEYMVDKYDMSSSTFAIQVNSLDEVYRMQDELTEVDGVAEVVSVATILPTVKEQEEALESVEDLKDILETRAPLMPANKDMLYQIVTMLDEAATDYEDVWLDNGLAILHADDFDTMHSELDALSEELSGESKPG